MTEPDNSSSSTRPISVAELLAKNGTIGAPPAGGRRRRRRGNADAVTVAELTGEIPIITDRPQETREEPARDTAADETTRVPLNGAEQQTVTEAPQEDTADVAEPVTEEPAPEDTAEPAAPEAETAEPAVEVVEEETVEAVEEEPEYDADEMSPDPLLDDDESADDAAMELDEPALLERSDDDDELPSYLRSSAGTLFGGGTVADDLARRRGDTDTIDDELDELETDVDADVDEDEADLDEELREETAANGRMSAFLRGAWIVGQCVIAVAFGAGLFIAFDQLWKWNNIVALVLSVLVILGLVVGVRVVRKTEDIGSTLIAVAVGALVTLGPLALLQSG
ncbi:hypothetical protein ACQI4L_25205 [Mycolicibacterium litorale]|uniref:hypothetical protein n=1 Tax=Mycolicibacterium litorale TaxID=758802 RepID=UPI003CEFD535